MERLALDRHYFAKPVRTLFNDVRRVLPDRRSRLRVYRVCEQHMALATEYVDSQLREGVTFDGSPLAATRARAGARRASAMPLPGSKYCPSHKHLDEDFEVLPRSASLREPGLEVQGKLTHGGSRN